MEKVSINLITATCDCNLRTQRRKHAPTLGFICPGFENGIPLHERGRRTEMNCWCVVLSIVREVPNGRDQLSEELAGILLLRRCDFQRKNFPAKLVTASFSKKVLA
jgi:hypothetical protein